MRELTSISYRNLRLLIKEQHHQKAVFWHINWGDNKSYGQIIEKCHIYDEYIDIWVNLQYLVLSSQDIQLFRQFFLMYKEPTLSSQFIDKLLSVYNVALYPELNNLTSPIFRDGNFIYSSWDFNTTSLSYLERLIINEFSQYEMCITLKLIESPKGGVVGETFVGHRLGLMVSEPNVISGEVKYILKKQERRAVMKKISNQLSVFCVQLSKLLSVKFYGVRAIFDCGFEFSRLGETLGDLILSGGHYEEKVA